MKGIKNNHIDFGFISNIGDLGKYSNIEATLVKKEEYVLIVPKNHHLANKEEMCIRDRKSTMELIRLIFHAHLEKHGGDRNSRKSSVMNLLSTTNQISTINYRAYYFCCNLDLSLIHIYATI